MFRIFSLSYQPFHNYPPLFFALTYNEAVVLTHTFLYKAQPHVRHNELLSGTDIHTLAKQMGTSVLMSERHYSKLTATMAAEKLALIYL